MLYAQQIGLPLKGAQKGYGGPLRAAGSRLTSPRVHFQVGVLPELFDSDQHPSRHQILAFFCAAIGSLRPLAHDEGLDLFPGGAAAERFPQIRSVLSIKTQVPDPVSGQATTVAASAERFGCGGDDAEDGPVGQKEPLRDDRGDVLLIDRAGKARVVSTGWESLEGMAWAPSGKEIWFSAAE